MLTASREHIRHHRTITLAEIKCTDPNTRVHHPEKNKERVMAGMIMEIHTCGYLIYANDLLSNDLQKPEQPNSS